MGWKRRTGTRVSIHLYDSGSPTFAVDDVARAGVGEGSQAVIKPVYRAPRCFLIRSSCSLISGIKASPKSDASNTGRISISLGPSIGLGQLFTHSTAWSMSFAG